MVFGEPPKHGRRNPNNVWKQVVLLLLAKNHEGSRCHVGIGLPHVRIARLPPATGLIPLKRGLNGL